MTTLTQFRAVMAKSPYFALKSKDTVTQGSHSSVLPKLSVQGNLISGATARVGVGFLLNPVTVLKARFEVSIYPGYS
jgi:solute carrier family 25 protein 38